MVEESDTTFLGTGNAMPVEVLQPEGIANAVAWLVSDEARYITGVTLPVDAGLHQQALIMARNPAAQTAFGPMVQAAIEQYEAPERRLVSDDLALSMLPAGQRAMVRAMRWPLLRRLTMGAGERAVPGSWVTHCVPQALHRRQAGRGPSEHRLRRHSRRGPGHKGIPPRASIRHPGLRGRPSGQHRAQEGGRATRDRCAARVGSLGTVVL